MDALPASAPGEGSRQGLLLGGVHSCAPHLIQCASFAARILKLATPTELLLERPGPTLPGRWLSYAPMSRLFVQVTLCGGHRKTLSCCKEQGWALQLSTMQRMLGSWVHGGSGCVTYRQSWVAQISCR